MIQPVKDIDKGWNDIVTSLGDMHKSGVKIGVQESAPKRGDRLSPVVIAASNEFGVMKNGKQFIPERSFLRSTVDEQKERYIKMLSIIAEKAMENPNSLMKNLQKLGLVAQKDIKAKIVDLREPANAELTLEKKFPKTNPLIDTGQMLNSIQYQVKLK